MTISIEFKDGFYYWTLKDESGITNDWATSLGGVFEQIIEDRVKSELRNHDRNKHSDPVEYLAD